MGRTRRDVRELNQLLMKTSPGGTATLTGRRAKQRREVQGRKKRIMTTKANHLTHRRQPGNPEAWKRWTREAVADLSTDARNLQTVGSESAGSELEIDYKGPAEGKG